MQTPVWSCHGHWARACFELLGSEPKAIPAARPACIELEQRQQMSGLPAYLRSNCPRYLSSKDPVSGNCKFEVYLLVMNKYEKASFGRDAVHMIPDVLPFGRTLNYPAISRLTRCCGQPRSPRRCSEQLLARDPGQPRASLAAAQGMRMDSLF